MARKRDNSGYAIIEMNHNGISDEDLRPEEFSEYQQAVIKALPEERRTEILRGVPVVVIDTGTGKDICSFNRGNVKPTDFELEMLGNSLFRHITAILSDPEKKAEFDKRFQEYEKSKITKGSGSND